MRRLGSKGRTFLILGVVFTAIGVTQQTTFLYAGLALLAIAAASAWRSRRR